MVVGELGLESCGLGFRGWGFKLMWFGAGGVGPSGFFLGFWALYINTEK